MDDLTYETTGSVPEPRPGGLLVLGMVFLALARAQRLNRHVTVQTRILRRIVPIGLAIACLTSPTIAQQPSVDQPSVSPSAVLVGSSTPVRVSARVSSSGKTLISNSVTAYWEDETGRAVSTLVVLNDSGQNGDSSSGDGIFSGQFVVDRSSAATMELHVSAAFVGVLRRVVSPAVTLVVADGFSAIGPSGGVIEASTQSTALHGARINIPAGAAGESVQVYLLASTDSLPNDLLGAGPMVTLGPSGYEFSKPVQVTLPYNDVDNDGLVDGTSVPEANIQVFSTNDGLVWSPLQIVAQDISLNLITVETTHFSSVTTAVGLALPRNWAMVSADASDWSEESVYEPAKASGDQPLFRLGESPEVQGSIDGKVLRIRARRGGRDRIKLRTGGSYGQGTYRWRAYVPYFVPGDPTGLGAFIYRDEKHELDFEVGYGNRYERGQLGSSLRSDEALLFLVSQANSAAANSSDKSVMCESGHCFKRMPLKQGAWHEFRLSLTERTNGTTDAVWSVDGAEQMRLTLMYVGGLFAIYCSVETLDQYGDNPTPSNDTVGYFDTVTFGQAGSRCLSVSGEGLSNGVPIPGWNIPFNPEAAWATTVTAVTSAAQPGAVHSGTGAVRVNGDWYLGKELDRACHGVVVVDYWHYPQPGFVNASVGLFGGSTLNDEFLHVMTNAHDQWVVVAPTTRVLAAYSGRYTHVVITLNTDTGLFGVTIDGAVVTSGQSVFNLSKLINGLRCVTVHSGVGGVGQDSFLDDLVITETH